MDDAVKVHPPHEHCSFTLIFLFIMGVLFVSMSAPVLGGFV